MAVSVISTRVIPLVATTPSLSFPPPGGTEKERAWSPTPATVVNAAGNSLLNCVMYDGLMLVIRTMITL